MEEIEKKERVQKKAQFAFSLIFLLLLVSILSLFYSIAFRKQKDISDDEKRTLQKIPVFTGKTFLDTTYQTQMEDALSDQILFSQQIRFGTKQFYHHFTKQFTELDETIEKLKTARSKKDVEVTAKTDVPKIANPEIPVIKLESNGETEENAKDEVKAEPAKPVKTYVYKEVLHDALYTLDSSGWIVVKGVDPQKYNINRYPQEMLDKVEWPKYLYFIETSESKDFNDMKKYDAFSYVKSKMKMTDYACLTFDDFEEYKDKFYQTDHHWNYKASYDAYVQIMRMMEGEDFEVRIPTGTKTYDTIFNGSFSWQAGIKFSSEKFTVYEFDLPEYKTYINDKRRDYSNRYLYDSTETMPHMNFSNHYGWYYGLDFAKVVYDYNQPEKESILILGTSYTNAINDLIASHYNKTHILDFRLYEETYGEKIDAAKYMEENGLTKLLIIGDISSVGKRMKEVH
ncbi:MAG: hypothetical protein K6G52_07220 [Treponemataceae bacterium]|nr:hypothetical protein [Treponemataceae bacterium]